MCEHNAGIHRTAHVGDIPGSISVPRDILWNYSPQQEDMAGKTRQKAEKVVTPSVVGHRLKNEAERLTSLDSQIKYIFLGLGCGILTKAFLIVQLQLKVTQVNNYSYLSLKNMKNGNNSPSHLFICFTLKYHSKENKKLNQILGWEGNELKPFIKPEINVS